jgi:hypothetical protein
MGIIIRMETITKSQAEEILKRLSNLETRMNLILGHLIEEDKILTETDLQVIKEAEEEYKKGRTISHEQLKKELGLKCSE